MSCCCEHAHNNRHDTMVSMFPEALHEHSQELVASSRPVSAKTWYTLQLQTEVEEMAVKALKTFHVTA